MVAIAKHIMEEIQLGLLIGHNGPGARLPVSRTDHAVPVGVTEGRNQTQALVDAATHAVVVHQHLDKTRIQLCVSK